MRSLSVALLVVCGLVLGGATCSPRSGTVISSNSDPTWKRLIDFTDITQKPNKAGVNICFKSENNDLTFKIIVADGVNTPTTLNTNLTSGVGIQIESRFKDDRPQIMVKKTENVRDYDYAVSLTVDDANTGSTDGDFDGKIGLDYPILGGEPSPFFIGVNDARGTGICQKDAKIASLNNSSLRLRFDDQTQLLIISSNRTTPQTVTWQLKDSRVPIWGCRLDHTPCP